MRARLFWASATVFALLGCTALNPTAAQFDADALSKLQQLLPADALFVGEQHDAPDHQRIERVVVEALVSQQALAALALEMVAQGQSTEKLEPDASDDAVRAALQWNNGGWPWAAYGPAVMTAVRAGVPVLGANLSKARLFEAMKDAGLDALLSGPKLLAQQDKVRVGHCHLLPEDQIAPMTRVQIARDVAMAKTVAQAARPGKTVLLLAGGSHVDGRLGVPLHLPPGLQVKTVILQARQASDDTEKTAQFDQAWSTEPAPAKDYCADFSKSRKPAAAASAAKNTS